MEELPFLQKVAEEKKEQGLRLIVVSVDSSFTETQSKQLSKIGITAPVVHDEYQIVRSRYGYEGQLPYTIFINREGVVKSISSGFSERKKEQLLQTIDEVLLK